MQPVHFIDVYDFWQFSYIAVPAGSPSRGGYVKVYVLNINQPSLPTPFFSLLKCFCVYFSLTIFSTVFYSINSPNSSQLSHSVLPTPFLPYWSFQLYISLLSSSSVCLVFFTLSLCLARWFWPDLMNGRHDHTTAVCVSLRLSGGLRVVQLPATFSLVTCMRCVVSCDSTSFPWLVFFFGALL